MQKICKEEQSFLPGPFLIISNLCFLRQSEVCLSASTTYLAVESHGNTLKHTESLCLDETLNI